MLQLKKATKPTKTLEGIEKTGTINISDPNVADEFARFMKETDPVGHAKIQKVVDDANQQLELKRFKPPKGEKDTHQVDLQECWANEKYFRLDRRK